MFEKWIQTTPYTCGPSSLMTALGETRNEPMSHDHEMGIWNGAVSWYLRYILAKLIGTPPCLLVRYMRKDLNLKEHELHIFYKDWADIKDNSHQIKYRVGVWLHDHVLVPLCCRNSARFHSYQELPEWVEWMLKSDPRRRLLMNIVMKDGVLHFILARMDPETNQILIMDPWPYKDPYPEPWPYPYPYPDGSDRSSEAKNDYYTIEEFKEKIGPVIFGYTISMIA